MHSQALGNPTTTCVQQGIEDGVSAVSVIHETSFDLPGTADLEPINELLECDDVDMGFGLVPTVEVGMYGLKNSCCCNIANWCLSMNEGTLTPINSHTGSHPPFEVVAVPGIIDHWEINPWHLGSTSIGAVSPSFDDRVEFDFDLFGTHLDSVLLKNLPFLGVLSTIEQPGKDQSTMVHHDIVLLIIA